MIVVHSDVEPETITLVKIDHGVAILRVAWNIQRGAGTDPDGIARQEWQYSERKMDWTLPYTYTSGGTTVTLDTVEHVKTYLDLVQSEIVNWAQATGLSSGGGDL